MMNHNSLCESHHISPTWIFQKRLGNLLKIPLIKLPFTLTSCHVTIIHPEIFLPSSIDLCWVPRKMSVTPPAFDTSEPGSVGLPSDSVVFGGMGPFSTHWVCEIQDMYRAYCNLLDEHLWGKNTLKVKWTSCTHPFSPQQFSLVWCPSIIISSTAVCHFEGKGPSPWQGFLVGDVDMARVGDPRADLRSGCSRFWEALSGKHLIVWEVPPQEMLILMSRRRFMM